MKIKKALVFVFAVLVVSCAKSNKEKISINSNHHEESKDESGRIGNALKSALDRINHPMDAEAVVGSVADWNSDRDANALGLFRVLCLAPENYLGGSVVNNGHLDRIAAWYEEGDPNDRKIVGIAWEGEQKLVFGTYLELGTSL